jgi:hypothetical protein
MHKLQMLYDAQKRKTSATIKELEKQLELLPPMQIAAENASIDVLQLKKQLAAALTQLQQTTQALGVAEVLSFCLLCWYKSANSDADGAARRRTSTSAAWKGSSE